MKIIALDAGHGMSNRTTGVYDPGATLKAWQEHILAKGLVRRVGKHLEATYPGAIKCVYPSGKLTSRHPWAVSKGAIRYVSVHFNSGNVDGFESFVHTDASAAAKALRAELHNRIVAVTGFKDRGKKARDFAVLGGKLPAVLLEICGMNAANLARYQASVEAVVGAISGAIAAHLGLAVPPAPQPERKFLKATMHIDATNEAAFTACAKELGAAAFVEPTPKDSWKTWPGRKVN